MGRVPHGLTCQRTTERSRYPGHLRGMWHWESFRCEVLMTLTLPALAQGSLKPCSTLPRGRARAHRCGSTLRAMRAVSMQGGSRAGEAQGRADAGLDVGIRQDPG